MSLNPHYITHHLNVRFYVIRTIIYTKQLHSFLLKGNYKENYINYITQSDKGQFNNSEANE